MTSVKMIMKWYPLLNEWPEQEQHQEETATAVDEEEAKHHLIVWNDDVNTFDHVIQALIEICDHSPEQAEQCTLLIHFKGKCSVKSGLFEKLRPMAEALIDRDINATIED